MTKRPFSDPKLAAEAGRKSGAARRQAKGGPGDLGPLEDHADAKRWLTQIGRAVAAGEMDHRAGYASIRAIETWMKAVAEEMTVLVVKDLAGEVKRLKAELGATRPRVVG